MSAIARIKADIICYRRKVVTGKACGNCAWAKAHGTELKCRNPKSPRSDQSVRLEGDECPRWMKEAAG